MRISKQCPGIQWSSRDEPVRLEVSLARRLDNALGQRGSGRVAVPASGLALTVEVIAQRLLVEARLAATWLIAVRRPEARAVRRQHLVDQQDPPALGSEFELRVGDDDAAL